MIAPRIAAGAAMRSAAKRLGSAARRRTFVSFLTAPPPYAWTTSSAVLSALRNPTSVPTSVVKNTDSAARMMFGAWPWNLSVQDRRDRDDRQAVRHDAEPRERPLEDRAR